LKSSSGKSRCSSAEVEKNSEPLAAKEICQLLKS